MDVDVIADIQQPHIGPLLAMLDCEYYASETAMRHALEQKSCFNLIHLPTSFKVDVFVHRRRAFDEAAFARTVMFELGHEPTFAVPVASLEDTIIAKLAWFQEGGGVSERQWNDVSILMKLHGESVDSRYLRDAAIQLEVAHLLDRLLIELS